MKMSTQECTPPCKCSYVQQWIDDHAKYFEHPTSKPEQAPLVTRIADRTFPLTNFPEALQINKTNIPYIPPPYRISPVRPLPPVRNYNQPSDLL